MAGFNPRIQRIRVAIGIEIEKTLGDAVIGCMKDDFDTDSDPESASSALYRERDPFGQFKRSNVTGADFTLRPISITKICLQAE